MSEPIKHAIRHLMLYLDGQPITGDIAVLTKEDQVAERALRRIAKLEAEVSYWRRLVEEAPETLRREANAAWESAIYNQNRAEAAEAALERVRGLQEHPAHVFLPTETRSDGQRTRVPQKAKVVLANELAAALKEEGE